MTRVQGFTSRIFLAGAFALLTVACADREPVGLDGFGPSSP